MSNLGRAVAGPEPTFEERQARVADGERLIQAFEKLTKRPVLRAQERVTPDDFKIKYDSHTADWGN